MILKSDKNYDINRRKKLKKKYNREDNIINIIK